MAAHLYNWKALCSWHDKGSERNRSSGGRVALMNIISGFIKDGTISTEVSYFVDRFRRHLNYEFVLTHWIRAILYIRMWKL